MVNLHLHFQSSAILTDRRKLKLYISEKLSQTGITEGSVDIIFVDDSFLLSMNQQYLNHDEFTDIITFNLSESYNHLKAELYISYERVIENAALLHVSIKSELLRVIFHGFLHIIGYNDKTTQEKQRMREQEDLWLHEYLS